MNVRLTPDEARVLYTLANRTWVPAFATIPMKSALDKLLIVGGGECCRDCVNLGVTPHRLGGMICRDHDPRAKEFAGDITPNQTGDSA